MAKRKGKIGRPIKITAEARRQIYSCLQVGGSLADAADVLSVNRTTLYRLRKTDSTFATGVKKAIKSGKRRLLNKMGKAKQWQAAAWMLERRWGREFGKKDHQTVKVSGELKHTATDMTKLIHDRDAIELANAFQRRVAVNASGNGQSSN